MRVFQIKKFALVSLCEGGEPRLARIDDIDEVDAMRTAGVLERRRR
jgi:hypothetical protein